MLCQNCGENEANVKYTQIINGVKKEMALCEKCSKELGVSTIDFNIPINLSSFLGEFLNEDESEILPDFINKNQLICDKCGMKYEEFVDEGKFGCENCYKTFSKKIDPILKNMHGGNRHIGRKGKVLAESSETNNKQTVIKEANKTEENKTEKLKQDLRIAIKEERYEDAAKIRDEIKNIENNK